MKLLLLTIALSCASALLVSPVASPTLAMGRATAPTMACNGGKGGQGGKNPPKDKRVYRPKLHKIIQQVWRFERRQRHPIHAPPTTRSLTDLLPNCAVNFKTSRQLPSLLLPQTHLSKHVPFPPSIQSDSEETVKSILLSKTTEAMLLKMNWK